MKNQQGFTLIELMMVIAIVAILTAIAVPAYQNYAIKANRADTQALMSAIIQDQEKYFVTYLQYTGELGAKGLKYNLSNDGVYADAKAYKITLAHCDGKSDYKLCATVLATAEPKQKGDADCQTMRLQTDGARSSKDNADQDSTAKCWR